LKGKGDHGKGKALFGETVAITSVAGFAKVFREASKVLTV
jgi:hypothetical protein